MNFIIFPLTPVFSKLFKDQAKNLLKQLQKLVCGVSRGAGMSKILMGTSLLMERPLMTFDIRVGRGVQDSPQNRTL